MKINFKKILNELSYRVSTGIPDLTNEQHLMKLWDILKENNWNIDARVELLKNLQEKIGKVYVQKGKGPSGVKLQVGPRGGKYYMGNPETGEPAPEATKDDDKDKEPTDKKLDKEKVDKIQKELYGEDGKGPLLQESETTQQALDNGYKKGEPWVAPGNAGSNFNENISNEGSLILEKYPDLTEEELAEILYRKTLDTNLGKQQKKTIVESPNKGDKGSIPEGVENKDLYKFNIIAARSAKSKNDRAKLGKQKAIDQVGFGEDTTQDVFGGTESDLKRLESKVEKANKIFVYDRETDKVYEIPKDRMVEWVKSSGGGENAADTSVITEDENGNIIYDGWSDKKGFNDIQANGTLFSDFTKKEKITDKLVESGNLDENTANQVKDILSKSKDEVKELENQYKKTGIQLSKHFESLEGEDRERAIKHLEEQNKGYEESGTTNHIQNAMKHYGVDSFDELITSMANEGDKMSGDRIKIASRMGTSERKYLKNNNQDIPDNLDTRKIISDLREKALGIQKKTTEELNKLNGKTKSGKEKPVGDLMGFKEVTDDLHLDKIDEPKDDEDYDSILKRNTELAMAGEKVSSEDIKKCLGVKNTSDAQDNFKVLTEERFTKDRETNKFTTGKVVEIFAIDKEGKKKFIGVKTYRGKNGPDSKTSTTTQWSHNMQKCFDGGKS